MYQCIKWMKGTVKSTTGSHTHTCFATECEKVCLVNRRGKIGKDELYTITEGILMSLGPYNKGEYK